MTASTKVRYKSESYKLQTRATKTTLDADAAFARRLTSMLNWVGAKCNYAFLIVVPHITPPPVEQRVKTLVLNEAGG